MNTRSATALLLLALARPVAAADPELANYKSGIDVTWGGTKGVAYQEEYGYHDKLVVDTKQVWIRDDTTIVMGHNDRNVASLVGRPKTVIGADGGGIIRYRIDQIWQEHQWAPNADGGGTLYPAYTGPFTLASQRYEAGVPVVGTTGGNGVTPRSNPAFYWRGLLDAAGDEWHVLSYADDDSALGGMDDAWASDGKWVLLVVNPKTPALTIRKVGNGQFYTTPAWTYWTPKIHDQTTYFQGTCTFEIRDIYGHDIHYRINGGSFIDAGAPAVVLDELAFVDGTNTLAYYYEGNEAHVRTRTVVENPTHPGRHEGHGQRVFGWPDAWSRFAQRVTRAPYAALLAAAQTANGSGQPNWDSKGGTGLLFGGSNWPHANYHAGVNAIVAHHLGMTAVRPGAGKSYAQYAKEMLLESPLNQAVVGYELNYWASMSIPAAATVYRGYWDANFAYSDAVAYDVLMDGFRSDQVSGGITPIEDHYVRDSLASWVHLCALHVGGFAEPGTGMWSTCRNIAATMIACVMPAYTTPYYGTCGMDGNTTVHAWAPFETHNYTWKDLFVDMDNATHAFTTGPCQSYGLEGPTGLIRPAGTAATWDPTVKASWVDKTAYASMGQCGHNIYAFANLVAAHGNLTAHAPLLNYLKEITEGSLYGNKLPPNTPSRQHAITVLNTRFPQAAANATGWVQSLPDSDPNSEASGLADAGLMGVFWYDDTYFGGPSVPTVATPVITPASSTGITASISATIACATPGAAIRYTIDGGEPTGGSTLYGGAIAVTNTTTLKARAFLAGYHDSGVATNTYVFVARPPPTAPSSTPAEPIALDIHAVFNHDGVVTSGEYSYCGWYATHDPATALSRPQVASGIYGVLGDHTTSDAWNIGRTFAEHPLATAGYTGRTGLPMDYRIGAFELGKGMTPPAGYNRYGRATWSADDWPALPIRICNDLHFSRGTVEIPLVEDQRARYAGFNILFTTWRGTVAASYTARVEALYAGGAWTTVWESVATTTAANQPGGSFATGNADALGYNGTWQDGDGVDPNAFGGGAYPAVRPVVAFTNNRFVRNAGSGSTQINTLDASLRYLWTWDSDPSAAGNQGVPLNSAHVLESLRFTATSSSSSGANRLHLYAISAEPAAASHGTLLQLR